MELWPFQGDHPFFTHLVKAIYICYGYGVIVIGAEDAVSSERGAIDINYTTLDTCLIREPAREC